MKNIYKSILLFLLLINKLSFSQNIDSLDNKYGFRNYKFETNINYFKNLKEIEKDFYIDTINNNIKIGDYEIYQIVYGFYNNQLQIIFLKTKGFYDSDGILSILKLAYGNGVKTKYNQIVWIGNKTTMIYNINSKNGNAIISIYSNMLMQLMEYNNKRNNINAIQDL